MNSGEYRRGIDRSSDLQAHFDSYLPPLPSSLGASQCVWLRLSFLLTAAGQSWILTRFPNR